MSVVLSEKRCPTCGQIKPATEEYFHRNKSCKDGLAKDCKECAKARAKKWAEDHPDRVRETHRRWDEQHPGVTAARAKKWREEHPDRAKELQDAWRISHASELAARHKAYSKANWEHIYQTHLKYNAEHPEKTREIGRAAALRYRQRHPERAKLWAKTHADRVRFYIQWRRAKALGLSYTLSAEDWRETLEYFDHACAYCGKPDTAKHDIQQDHVIPSSQGGEYVLGNIVPACKSCNSGKADSDLLDWYPRQPFFDPSRLERLQAFIAESAQVEEKEEAVNV